MEYAYPILLEADEMILGLRFIAKDVQYDRRGSQWADGADLTDFHGADGRVAMVLVRTFLTAKTLSTAPDGYRLGW